MFLFTNSIMELISKLKYVPVCFITILGILTSEVYCADYYGGSDSGWMLFPIDARVTAMGRAGVAVINNAHSPLYNPGMLPFMDGIQCAYSYNPSSFSNHIYYASLLTSIKSVKTSIHYGLFDVAKGIAMDNTGATYSINPQYDYWGISVGHKIRKFGIGITAKYFKSNNGEVKDNTLACNIGVLYSHDILVKKRYKSTINAGVSLSNIGGSLDYDIPGESYGLPNTLRIGYSVTTQLPKKEHRFIPLIITHNFQYSDVLNYLYKYNPDYYKGIKSAGWGIEMMLYEILALRTGYHYRTKYRYVSHGEDSETVEYNYISMHTGTTYGFGLNVPLKYFKKSWRSTISYNYSKFPLGGIQSHLDFHTISLNYSYK